MNLRQTELDSKVEGEDSPIGGSNFLVSAVMLLKKQKKDLQSEVSKLREKVSQLENQNAAFMNVSADRLLKI
ncbi:MAG: hypothetical protein J0L93_02420 [Deltaproteobacteria bacterium]|nr:hypothetical protein [Deltaproteobacteria bacterium]